MAGTVVNTTEPRIEKEVNGPAKTFKSLIKTISYVPKITDDEKMFKGGVEKDKTRKADRTDDGDRDADDKGKIVGYGNPNSDDPISSDGDSTWDSFDRVLKNTQKGYSESLDERTTNPEDTLQDMKSLHFNHKESAVHHIGEYYRNYETKPDLAAKHKEVSDLYDKAAKHMAKGYVDSKAGDHDSSSKHVKLSYGAFKDARNKAFEYGILKNHEFIEESADEVGVPQATATGPINTSANQMTQGGEDQENPVEFARESLENIATKAAQIFDIIKQDQNLPEDVVDMLGKANDMVNNIFEHETFSSQKANPIVQTQTPKNEGIMSFSDLVESIKKE